jgi:hypothetical protein
VNEEAEKELKAFGRIIGCLKAAGWVDAAELVDDILRRQTPDPETGLVPCGCGGVPKLHKTVLSGTYGIDHFSGHCFSSMIHWVECARCGVKTESHFPGVPLYQARPVCPSEKEATDAWNAAMGYKP